MSFVEVQQNFMDYIKDPSLPLPEGIEARRMNVYRELFFNNIDGFVSNAFPVLKSLYTPQDWQQLVQTFFVTHNCHTPIFIEIAQEFLLFLQTEYQSSVKDPDFMLELAHYEWLELVVAVARDDGQQHLIDIEQVDLQSIKLCVSAASQIAQYAYDVQNISTEYVPKVPGETPQFFCIYRDLDEEVSFLHLNPLTAQVLAYITQYEYIVFPELLDWLIQTYSHIEAPILEQGCLQLLIDLSDRGIIRQFIDK
ncbi:DUF2063 domain-containing protein [Shewanella sairae]|uniref:DUF2063 domain-containing protein n=1 Tax=Shewanella sairae TaxID=190310 RepID=A0ABQ4PPT3_9GAMM|nr:putative DNA-binding domain-containing protein [Shewanella sairae]MCL1130370.1 putative DNA-binding domain-containing protein [Shewanella sairae]GIU50610.1 DUF2063 domain-containing protein [Shewanella sairae]